MEQILNGYQQLTPTTWVYLSSLLAIAIYFKFSRVWSVRNLDLIGLIALGPGLRMAQLSGTIQQVGFVWLFCVGAFFLVRLLMDPMMVRRPLLEPNLSPGGLTFIGVSLLVFMFANVITKQPTESDLDGARRLDAALSRSEAPDGEASLAQHGPGYPLLHLVAAIPSKTLLKGESLLKGGTDESKELRGLTVYEATARTMAILCHLAVVIGIVLIGARHFDNVRTGIAAAALYLMLPYTALMTGRVDHVLPAALLVWAVYAYRRPAIAGGLLGLAAGVIYYPVFLLPLWLGFYWQRGLFRFVAGFLTMLSVLVASLVFTSGSVSAFVAQMQQMFGWTSLNAGPLEGFWAFHEAATAYRIPVLAAFAVLCGGLALWPARKNLGTLLSCSAAVMLGTQFWHAQGGGLYMCWYLPLLLLTVFRPNLEDRVALSVLGESWFAKRRAHPTSKAA
jgi:hypothetical protein